MAVIGKMFLWGLLFSVLLFDLTLSTSNNKSKDLAPVSNTSPKFFDATDDVKITAFPRTVINDSTKDLTISCVFSRQQDSDFTTLLSLILSKTDTNSEVGYSELATITSASSDYVEKKKTLSAEVSGKISANNESFIRFKWSSPNKDVVGRYYCEAHGLDKKGHPRLSAASVVVKRDVTTYNNRLLERIMALEATQKVLQSKLTRSKHATVIAWTTWHGHTYYLSRPIIRDVAAATTVCRQLGGYLVEIDNEEEYMFVSNLCFQLLNDTNRAPGVIIGATDGGHEGNWTFLESGNQMTTVHWAPNEPNGGNKENCLFISAHSKLMFDAACAVQFEGRFMCEVDETNKTD